VVPGPGELAPPEGPSWSPQVPATRLGNRPPEGSAAGHPLTAARDDAHAALAILGSGVYVGGNRPIQAGSRYLLARVGDELQLLGPIHLDPGAIADRVPLRSVEAFVLEGRLLIAGRDAKSDVSMAFVAVSQEREVDIVASLSGRESAASAQ
jgi:hypothetical protein